MSQTPREYLVGLGLAKPGKGKFSREAHAALAKAAAEGVTFTEAIKPKPKAAPDFSGKALVRTIQAQARVDKPAVDSKAVRAWAATQGIAVGARGRVHPDIVSQYLAAHEGQDLPEVKVKRAGEVLTEAPRAYPEGQKFFGEVNGKRIIVSDRVACAGSGASLGYCSMQHVHTGVVGGHTLGLVDIQPLI